MKLLANRGDDDPAKTATDEADIHALMRVTHIETAESLAALLRACYPHLPGIAGERLAPRLDAKIASVLDNYDGTAPQATWNAGRGSATRDR